ncbi:MAG: uracil-DNA glycosylase [Prolixibacteraceae bacterium]|nr:uracil-DNA glycosylase [Prolixibacteraceae bacterium]
MENHYFQNEKQGTIEELNRQIKKCNLCPLSSDRIHALPGEGNVNARLFFIAQAPGEIEDNEGRMFVGPTGKVVDELFNESGLKRGEVYMTNLIKCRLPKNRKPKQKETELCSRYLKQEIEIVQPEFVIPLGYFATKFIFGFYLGKKELPEYATGKLFVGKKFKIFPLKHPSSVLYSPENMQSIKHDFMKIPVFKHECKWHPVCPMKYFYEQGKLDRKWIDLYCKGNWKSCVRYQMEERGQYHPDNMLPDGNIDESLQ